MKIWHLLLAVLLVAVTVAFYRGLPHLLPSDLIGISGLLGICETSFAWMVASFVDVVRRRD